jgi:Arc/MetJ-type ribon-helix-helix transcriptional regulator
MVGMGGNESKQVNVRLEEEDREAIEQLVSDGEYENVSAFIRAAIKEKLNPKLRRARLRKEISELLDDDPVLRRKLGLD